MIMLRALLVWSMLCLTKAQKWLELPPTPTLQASSMGKLADINGVKIWYTIAGNPESKNLPVILLHGGFGNSDYYGDLVPLIKGDQPVILMDTRGHGRSPYVDNMEFSFDLYASDVVGLLKQLQLPKAALVGWSHMAVGTIAAMMNPETVQHVDRAFLYGGYHNYAANSPTYNTTKTYQEFTKRAAVEFKKYQPQASLKNFAAALSTLDSTLPTYTDKDMEKITLGARVTVAFGDHEEAIKPEEGNALPQLIKGSKSVTVKNVSHFGILQDPQAVSVAINTFLGTA